MSTNESSKFGLVIASSILAGIVGYFVGIGSTLNISHDSKAPSEKGKSVEDSEIETEAEEEVSESEDDEPNGITSDQYAGAECKLVLVVRTDLGMTKGKIAAQAGHATLACYKSALKNDPAVVKRWESYGQAKVAVQVKSEDDLLLLQAQAMSLGITAKVIHDAGRTQIAAGSATVLGVGPAPKPLIDQVTGHLKLL
ncbi:peptidyl-tRNA hydrolase 2 [Ascobolus immersus RN42]|uniref:peptidyl-tRNA hydrolase n=1 Tax=Ascobolus immersus RN42 TaxID=1160509 RepID=A0A3N4IJ50_ASCIM|nr:peptidyl-tRNA hydrolase 2 [Ascobolus immersus RN42]